MVSAGCQNCYAMRLAGTRLKHHPSRRGLTKDTPTGPVWTGELRLNEEWLGQPLQWKKPRRIFVCAHSDLFHPEVPDEWLQAIFDVMHIATEHTYQVLTKRPERAAEWIPSYQNYALQDHIIVGTSVEDQDTAYERIPVLGRIPARTWISCEPLLGPLDLSRYFFLTHLQRPEWVVVGGESGPRARPMEHEWAEWVVEVCLASGIPCHVKQLSQRTDPDTWRDFERFPPGLRIRQEPERRAR